MCVEVIYKNIKVEFENIGEGYSGDYDPADPDDVNFLRYSVSLHPKDEDEREEWVKRFVTEIGYSDEWVPVRDGSYCTLMPSYISQEILVEAAKRVAEEVEDHLSDGRLKRLLEAWSWMEPSWFVLDNKGR